MDVSDYIHFCGFKTPKYQVPEMNIKEEMRHI